MTRQEPMTIMFIHGITEIGGAERELLRIVDRLSEYKYRALVVCPERGPLHDELRDRKIEVRSVPLPAWRKLRSYPWRPASVRCLRDVIVTARPALLHVNDIWWAPQTLRASMGLGVPILAHVRQEIESRKVRRYELDQLDQVLPVSQQVRSSLETGGVQPERLRTLYSGIDITKVPECYDGPATRRRFGIPVNTPLIGTLANLFPRKAYPLMLRAMPAILKSLPDAHYLIVGGGDAAYERDLQSLARTLGLQRHVHFAGFQESIYPCLAAMDVYVHPALMEGFGIAVLEAMAMRLAVVATATGGVPEIVRNGETGILVPPSNPVALSAAVVNVLRDTSRRMAMGKAGRKRVEAHFTIEIMMSHLSAVYDALLEKPMPALQPVSS